MSVDPPFAERIDRIEPIESFDSFDSFDLFASHHQLPWFGENLPHGFLPHVFYVAVLLPVRQWCQRLRIQVTMVWISRAVAAKAKV